MSKLIPVLLMLASCAPDVDRIIDSNVNEALKASLDSCSKTVEFYRLKELHSYQFPASSPTCMENKILTGCVMFKNHLLQNNEKLSESSWKFCEKYNSK